MEATFNFPINTLNIELITKIQALFSKNAIVKLSIIDKIKDETDYLLSVPENKEILKRSIEELRSNKLISKQIEDLT
ncbi:MAG: hypothetical protein B6I24_04775 [Bacteroidetes bacterium 4572_128]|nr:MAG: hypothetical protein B6I24_04775 [Bacteroidetes bacterium 4572_128]